MKESDEASGVLRLPKNDARAMLAVLGLIAMTLVGTLALESMARGRASGQARTFLYCPLGASRSEGRVVCGADGAAPLSAEQALLFGAAMDLNAASTSDLQIVSGLGPRLAQRILDERVLHGAFGSLEDVRRRVRGVGPALTRRMVRYFRVKEEGGPASGTRPR